MAVFLKTKPVTKSATFSPDLSPVSSSSSSSDFHVTQKALELTVTKSQTLSQRSVKRIAKDSPIIHQAIFHLYSK